MGNKELISNVAAMTNEQLDVLLRAMEAIVADHELYRRNLKNSQLFHGMRTITPTDIDIPALVEDIRRLRIHIEARKPVLK